jgi:prophage regulatory protein
MNDKKLGIARLPDVRKIVGLGRSSIYARLDPKSPYHDPTFPRPIILGGRARGWLVKELEEWLTARPRTSTANPGIEGGRT